MKDKFKAVKQAMKVQEKNRKQYEKATTKVSKQILKSSKKNEDAR